jgi:hypothetical protein
MGILSSLGDISGLFKYKTLDALWETVKAIAKGKISFKDIARSFVSSVTGPFMYLYNNTKWVWTGDPSNKEVKYYGNQLGTAFQLVVGSAGATAAIVKIVPKMAKLLGKIKPKKSSSSNNNNNKNRSKGCNCFTADTLILTDSGEKPIEEIKIGDKVLSRNEDSGEEAYKPVIHLFEREAYEIYNIHVGDQIIEATGNHPFWVQGEKWVLAAELEVGDLLLQTGGRTLKIDSITIEQRQETVYNFEVADFHTYFVSGLGVWVHNETCRKPGNYTLMAGSGLKYKTTIGKSGEVLSVFAKIEKKHIDKGTSTNDSSRSFARLLGNSTDDAGHVLGKKLGGPGGSTTGNIFPQNPGVNRGKFREFEKEVAREVSNGKEVYVLIKPKYKNNNTRPYEIVYNVRINGKTITKTFPNP